MNVLSLQEKFEGFTEHWNPYIIGELNNQYVKVAKFKGEFCWHSHEHEDELFYVLEGTLIIKLRDKDLVLNAGNMAIIPKGVEHCPVTKNNEEVKVLLFEPKMTVNTGEEENTLTMVPDWI
ncbi:cupin domain-containing protein [Kordia jejudonensis]|uniref:cupin domain-containing protein n=1 Tax=Kordia jejudonensis TaxID=1348245 RepID=UPI0006298DFD|nr:cupin domain-containing protein [Kordia jejudonensis]